MLLNDIEKNFPFISVVEYGGKEYVGVINNQDNSITSMYVYEDINVNAREKFMGLCQTWWWESNRMIPIGIFLRKELMKFKEKWSPWCSIATWYMWRSLDPVPVEY